MVDLESTTIEAAVEEAFNKVLAPFVGDSEYVLFLKVETLQRQAMNLYAYAILGGHSPSDANAVISAALIRHGVLKPGHDLIEVIAAASRPFRVSAEENASIDALFAYKAA